MLIDIRQGSVADSTCKNCDFVLDFNSEGDLVGIEYIGFNEFLNGVSFERIKMACKEKFKADLSFDKDSDCFYIKIKSDHSTTQKNVNGFLCRGPDNSIVAISVDLN